EEVIQANLAVHAANFGVAHGPRHKLSVSRVLKCVKPRCEHESYERHTNGSADFHCALQHPARQTPQRNAAQRPWNGVLYREFPSGGKPGGIGLFSSSHSFRQISGFALASRNTERAAIG